MINVSESFRNPETGWRKPGFSTGKEKRVLRHVRKTLRPARQKIAGMLGVFQDFLTKRGTKFAAQTRAGI